MEPKPIEFVDGVYSEEFGSWRIRADENPLGVCSVVAVNDVLGNTVGLDSDGDVTIDARYAPLDMIERMAYVWRTLGGS